MSTQDKWVGKTLEKTYKQKTISAAYIVLTDFIINFTSELRESSRVASFVKCLESCNH